MIYATTSCSNIIFDCSTSLPAMIKLALESVNNNNALFVDRLPERMKEGEVHTSGELLLSVGKDENGTADILYYSDLCTEDEAWIIRKYGRSINVSVSHKTLW